MKAQILPESFLKCVSPADRKMLGQMTAAEGLAAFAAREEKELHKLISLELTRFNIVFAHSRMDKRTTNAKGLPDFLFVYHGIPYAIEAKAPKGVLTPEQVRTIVRMEENGWSCHVVRSFEEFKTILEKEGG